MRRFIGTLLSVMAQAVDRCLADFQYYIA
jgi:hypothetical protein